jgi:hypothetical protein
MTKIGKIGTIVAIAISVGIAVWIFPQVRNATKGTIAESWLAPTVIGAIVAGVIIGLKTDKYAWLKKADAFMRKYYWIGLILIGTAWLIVWLTK